MLTVLSTEHNVNALQNLSEQFWWESPNPVGQKGSIDGDNLRRIGH